MCYTTEKRKTKFLWKYWHQKNYWQQNVLENRETIYFN